MDKRQGFSEASGIGRRGDVADDLAIDGEIGAVINHVVVGGDDAAELHLFLALKIEESLLAAKISLAAGHGPTKPTFGDGTSWLKVEPLGPVV